MDYLKISELTEVLALLNNNELAVDVNGALRKVKYSTLVSAVIASVIADLPDEDITFSGDNTFSGNVDLSGGSLTPKIWDSAALAVSQIQTFAHGLGRVPVILDFKLLCVTANLGYVAGDEVSWLDGYSATRICGHYCNATNIITKTSSQALAIFQESLTTTSTITMANWKFRIRYI